MKEKILRKTITNADYGDDIANIPVQEDSLLHILEPAAAGISLHVNADMTEYMCFHQRGNISTLSGSSLKLWNVILPWKHSYQPRQTSARD